MTLTAAVSQADPTYIGKVVSIIDGDTLTLLDEHQQYRVRLQGIDAPERGQPFGNKASINLSELIFGKLVVADCPKIDRYGRLVCVIRAGGSDIGLMQLKAGMAWHYKKYASEQSPEDRETYAAAEQTARGAHRGLWQDPTPLPPWDWRHR